MTDTGVYMKRNRTARTFAYAKSRFFPTLRNFEQQ